MKCGFSSEMSHCLKLSDHDLFNVTLRYFVTSYTCSIYNLIQIWVSNTVYVANQVWLVDTSC